DQVGMERPGRERTRLGIAGYESLRPRRPIRNATKSNTPSSPVREHIAMRTRYTFGPIATFARSGCRTAGCSVRVEQPSPKRNLPQLRIPSDLVDPFAYLRERIGRYRWGNLNAADGAGPVVTSSRARP